MTISRRNFLQISLSTAALSQTSSILAASNAVAEGRQVKVKAIAFDGFPVFDPRPVFGLAEMLFPGKGAELGNTWRTRQFEYTWLRTLSGHYVDFWQVTEESLVFAALSLKLELTADKRKQLMQSYLELKAWPDALSILTELKQMGIKLAFLSNLTPVMLDASVKNGGLTGLFEPHLSTDRVSAYKPDPRAYQMGLDAFGVSRKEIVFAASAAWDAAGAAWFGYPTVWVNRMNLPVEELGVQPHANGNSLATLLEFVKARNQLA